MPRWGAGPCGCCLQQPPLLRVPPLWLRLPGLLDFHSLPRSYGTGAPVLRGVSFAVGGGRTLALVGATGSGKSTILRLLLRFYDPQAGRVLLDGQDVAGSTLASLRRCIAVVPQDTVRLWC